MKHLGRLFGRRELRFGLLSFGQICPNDSLVYVLETCELPLPRSLFKERLEPRRQQGPLALGQMPPHVFGDHKRQGRAALASVGAEARRQPSGQAEQVTNKAVQDLAFVLNDFLLTSVARDGS